MKYKVGDVVRVKDNLQLGEIYGECTVVEGVLEYRGTLHTIDGAYTDGYYILKPINDIKDTTYYLWKEDMLELVETKEDLK